MKRLSPLAAILVVLAMQGCAASAPTAQLDADRFRAAPSWDSSYVRNPECPTGIFLRFSFGAPLDAYWGGGGRLKERAAEYGAYLLPYPLDTTLVRIPPPEAGVWGPYSEYMYAVHNRGLFLQSGASYRVQEAIFPTFADTATSSFISAVPPGHYLLSIVHGTFDDDPAIVKDVFVKEGFVSVVWISLMPQPIY